MPNPIRTHLLLKGDNQKIQRLLESVKSKDTEFSLHQITPQPQCLDFSPYDHVIKIAKQVVASYLSGNISEIDDIDELVGDSRFQLNNDNVDSVIKCVEAYAKTGYFYWYGRIS